DVDLVKKYQWLVIRRETPGEDRSQLDLDIASTDAFFKKQGVAPPNPITNIPLKGTSSTERRKEFANVTTIVHEISNSPEEKPGFSSKYKLLQEKLESSNNITTGLDLSKELREGVFPAEAYVDNILDPKISVQIDSLSCLSNIVLPILLRPLKERNEPLQKVILYGDAVDSEKAEFVAQKYLEFGFQVTRLSNTITAKDAIERLES
ncbi:MAG: hypothetical protein JSS09_06555, partial [Verrucomicrobia bacterium]|nr:hypothetical protein [Verrucomicrobiota bacterium]